MSTNESSPTIEISPFASEAPPHDDSPRFEGGRYRILGKVGAGGMGEVFEAEDTASGRIVVIKVLHREFVRSPDFADRMRIEGEVLGSLRHPNLVTVEELGKTKDGRPYLVMERLSGRTLRAELVARKAIPPIEAIDFICQVLAGLGAAHAFGIVHRDVKPDNLFVCEPQGGRRTVKVLDFGVAKVLPRKDDGPCPEPLAQPTAQGILVGTPRFAAPEQFQSGSVDPRADIYAAGLVLYAMIAGRGPFDHLKGEQLIRAHLAERPKPPSHYAPLSIAPELDGIVMKALAKSPEDRYPSASQLVKALTEFAASCMTAVQEGVFRPGDRCGPYRIGRLLAKGGLTEIYEGVHVYTARTVALKCLQARHGNNPDFRDQMQSEAIFLAKIDHPQVLRLYDAGTTRHRVAWTAMERLHGNTLREILNDVSRLPVERALRYASRIAEGVCALHALGIVHRDLKPEHIFVTEMDDIKVLDLSAASTGSEQTASQRRARRRGTPAYMSPEQLRCNALNDRSDVYALAHIVYEMLLGRHAFARSKHRWPACGELIAMQLHEEPQHLPDLLRDLPAAAWHVLRPALAKEAGNRPTMASFGRDLHEMTPRRSGHRVGAGRLSVFAERFASKGRGDKSERLLLAKPRGVAGPHPPPRKKGGLRGRAGRAAWALMVTALAIGAVAKLAQPLASTLASRFDFGRLRGGQSGVVEAGNLLSPVAPGMVDTGRAPRAATATQGMGTRGEPSSP